ncbi:MAG: hypothetical protein NZZ41_05385 [Candidatus Dojkabacteria bacterium]|nr:hypothetical protein [Candidatus Dojkabacteria bacterium]
MSYKKYIKNYVSSILLKETYQVLSDYEFIKKHYNLYGPKAYIRFLNEKPSHINVLFRNREHKGHSDPSGIYAFPVSYVLENYHNQDLNIFFSKRYILALVDKSKNKFVISELRTLGEWREIFDRMGLSLEKQIELLKLVAEKNYSPLKEDIRIVANNLRKQNYKGKVFSPHVLFLASQVESFSNEKIKIYSGEKQRLFWLRAGFDAIEDLGEGIIHRDEPSQIIFLKEDACDLVDIFDKEQTFSTLNAPIEKRLEKVLSKFLGLLFQKVLNDHILERIEIQIEKAKDDEFMDDVYYFSASMKGEKYHVHILYGRCSGKIMEELRGFIRIQEAETLNILFEQQFFMNKENSMDDVLDAIQKNFESEMKRRFVS